MRKKREMGLGLHDAECTPKQSRPSEIGTYTNCYPNVISHTVIHNVA